MKISSQDSIGIELFRPPGPLLLGSFSHKRKQQLEGLRTEDPSTQESHHDNGRVFAQLKQPSSSGTLGEKLIRMEETHVFGNDR